MKKEIKKSNYFDFLDFDQMNFTNGELIGMHTAQYLQRLPVILHRYLFSQHLKQKLIIKDQEKINKLTLFESQTPFFVIKKANTVTTAVNIGMGFNYPFFRRPQT